LDWPVVSVASVHESWDVPRVWDATTLVATTDYLADSKGGILHRPYGLWSKERQSIRTIYTVGYVEVPLEIEQFCINLVLRRFRRRGAENVGSRSLGDGSLSYFSLKDMTDEDRAFLSRISRRRYF